MRKEIKKLISLENFVGIILALLPLYLGKVVFFGMSLNFLEIMIGGAFLWWLLKKRFGNLEWKDFLRNHKTIFSLIGIIFLSLALSTFFNGNLRVGFGIIKGWFIFPLITALIAVDLFRNKKIKAWRFFYGGAVGVATLALVGFFLGQITYDGRLQGIFNSPNYLAMYLAPAIIIGTVLFTENRKQYGLSLAIIALAFFLTYSFAAWLVIAIVLVGLFFLARKDEKNRRIFIGFVALIGLVFLLQTKTDKLNNLLNLDARSSLSSRSMIWESAGKLVLDNPIWGIGPGNFQEKYLEYQKYFPPYLEWAVPHPHNLYLAFYLYAGIAGLLAFLLLIFFWLKKIIQRKEEKIVLVAVGIIIYVLLHGILDTTYFKNDLAVIFWLAFFLPL